MSYNNEIQETGLFQSRRPDWSLSDTPETTEPVLGAYDYGQVDPYPGQGHQAADSRFLASPQTGNTQGVKDVPIQSWHQKLFTPTVQGNAASSPFVTGLSALANIFPQNHASVAANQQLFAHQAQQQQQQELLAERKKQAERELVRQGLAAIQDARKIPGKAGRAAYFKLLKEKQEAFGGGFDGTIDMFQKATDDEFDAAAAAFDEIIQKNPEWGLKDYQSISTDPKTAAMFGELTAKHLKLKQEKALGEALNRAVYGSQDTPQGTPEAPTAPGTPGQPAPSQGAPGQPQGQSSGMPKPGTGNGYSLNADQIRVVEKIKAEAQRQGLSPEETQALIGMGFQETNFYNRDNHAKNPRDGSGIFQFVPSTAARYGMRSAARRADGTLDPSDERLNEDKNIAGAVQMFKENRKRTGSVDGAILAHNGGGDPQYLQKVQRHAQGLRAYGGPGTPARPTSQAAQSQGTDAEQKALQTNQQKLAALDAAIERVTPIVLQDSTGQSQKALQALQAQRQVIESNIKRIEDRYDKQKPTAETQRAFEKLFPGKAWSQASPEEKQQAIAQSSTIAASEAGERAGAVAQAELGPKKEAAKASYEAKRVEQPHMYRGAKGEKMPGGMTLEQMSKMDEEYAKENPGQVYWTRLEKLNDKERADIRERTLFIDRLQEINDNVDKVITGPVAGRLERLKQYWGISANDEKTGLRLLLQQIINDKAFAQGGKTLPAAELDRIIATLPKDIDDPAVFRANVKAALKLAHQYHDLHIQGLEADGFTGLQPYRRAPKKETEANNIPSEPATPASPETPAESPLDRALREIREARQKKKKG